MSYRRCLLGRHNTAGVTPAKLVWSSCRFATLIFTFALCLSQALPVLAQFKLWQFPIVETTLTCEQADRVSHRALERLGYKVTSFTPASEGGEGVIRGMREEPLGQVAASVKITCGTHSVQVDASLDPPPCEQANQIMYRALERLGYTVTSFTPASDGGEGEVKGVRKGPQEQETVSVKITCGADAIYMDTDSDDNPLLDSGDFYLAITDFHRGFYAWFKGMSKDIQREEMSKPQGQVQVVMKPLMGLETKHEFGTEVTQMFPVRVEIFNTTERAYALEADQIMLLTPSGERVKPLGESSNAFPARALTSQTLAPGANVKGYLYYPPGSYTGAQGFLVEGESREREGFAIQF